MINSLMAIVQLPVARIRPMKGQPRKYFNKNKLQKLYASMKRAGQKLPVLVHPVDDDPEHDFELIDGERRWRGKKRAGDKYISGIVLNGEDAEEYFEMAAIANFGRESHSPMEIANALKRVRERRIKVDGSCTEADLAEIFAQDATWVSQHLLLLKLTREVQEMLDPEIPKRKRLTRSAGTQISRLPPEMQYDFAQRVVRDKLNLNQIRLYVRAELAAKSIEEEAPLVFRGRPVNRYRNLETLVQNFNKGSEVLLAIPKEELEAALKGQDRFQLEVMLRLMEQMERNLGRLRRTVRTVASGMVIERKA